MGSSAFLLPLEPRGLYREMLTQAWRRGGSLPDDPEAIQRACGVTKPEWRRTWPLVAPFWRKAAGGLLVNDTQLEVLAEAKAGADRASEHGLRGAMGRHKKMMPGQVPEHYSGDARVDARAGARADPEHVPEDKPPSPSPVRTAAAAVIVEGGTPSKGYLPPDVRLDWIRRGSVALREVTERANEDPTEALRKASTVKGSGWYLVRLDTAQDEHLVRTVQALEDRARKLRGDPAEADGHGLPTTPPWERVATKGQP